jgi:hypothetical protein
MQLQTCQGHGSANVVGTFAGDTSGFGNTSFAALIEAERTGRTETSCTLGREPADR